MTRPWTLCFREPRRPEQRKHWHETKLIVSDFRSRRSNDEHQVGDEESKKLALRPVSANLGVGSNPAARCCRPPVLRTCKEPSLSAPLSRGLLKSA